MFPHAARVSAREEIVGVAGQIADDDTDGFALIKVRLREQRFKVQRVQVFKGEKKNAKRND